jgi:hypothetical protein
MPRHTPSKTVAVVGTWLVGLLSLGVLVVVAQEGTVTSRHSLMRPFVVGRGGVRFWQHGGSTLIGEDYIRLTPDAQSKSGYLWNTPRLSVFDWETELEFRIGGSGRLGADGIGFWYVRDTLEEGPVFGSKDAWDGLLVAFDTFDNEGAHDNPYVAVILNDGTKKYDGAGDDGKAMQLGGCTSPFRNPGRNSKARIRYLGTQKKLSVMLETSGTDTWVTCFEGQAELPRGYYLGVTAATGGLSDNHDIYGIKTVILDTKTTPPTPTPATAELETEKQKDPSLDDLLNRINKIKNTPKETTTKTAEPVPPPPPPPPPQEPAQEPLATEVPPPQPPRQPRQPAKQAEKTEKVEKNDELANAVKHLEEQNKVLMEAVGKLVVMADGTARDVKEMSEESVRQLNEIKGATIRELTQRGQETVRGNEAVVSQLRSQVDALTKEISHLQEALHQMGTKTISTIESRTSWGFWLFLLIFQVLFVAALFIWYRMREEANKKLY